MYYRSGDCIVPARGLTNTKSSCTVSLWCIVFGLILCMACVQMASAFAGEYHYDLTRDATQDEGIGYQPQDTYIAINNLLVDAISTAHSSESSNNYLVPNVYANSEEIEKLFDQKAHFQNFKNNAALDAEWDRLLENTYQAVKKSEQTNDKRMLLVTLGVSLHTVQDFYAHSNWADQTDDGRFAVNKYNGDVTWFDIPDDIRSTVDLHSDYDSRDISQWLPSWCRADDPNHDFCYYDSLPLYTPCSVKNSLGQCMGYTDSSEIPELKSRCGAGPYHCQEDPYSRSDWIFCWWSAKKYCADNYSAIYNPTGHEILNKDWPSRPHFDTAYRQAYYASRQWIRLVKSWVSEDFWNAAMDPNIDTSDWGGITGGYDNLQYYYPVSLNNLYLFFTKLLWYSGGWNHEYSQSDTMVGLLGEYHGFITTDLTRNRDPKYRGLYALPEKVGFDYLYNQIQYNPPTPEAHPETLEKIPNMRWLRIQTYEIEQYLCQWDSGADIDRWSDADFYNILLIDGRHWYREAPYQERDHIVPNGWVTNIPLPMDVESVPVGYRLMEEDFTGRLTVSGDDHCDIANELNEKDWNRELSTSSYFKIVNTDGLRKCSINDYGNWGDGDEAFVNFSYEFIPRNRGAAIMLSKKASEPVINSGDTVTYTYMVTNEGSIPVRDVTVSDNAPEIIPTYVSGDSIANGQLDPGEIWTYTATTVLITQEQIITNTALVTGTYQDTDGVLKTAWNMDKETVIVINGPLNVASIHVPETPIAVNTAVSVSSTFTDTDAGGTHTAMWTWGDVDLWGEGQHSEGIVDQATDSVTGTHTYLTPGVYTISLKVTDNHGASRELDSYRYIVIYDPLGGYVTGSGHLISPGGPLFRDPEQSFGFVSDPSNGTRSPTDFQFKVDRDFTFRSNNLDRVVVDGAKVIFKGTGTFDHEGGQYNFILSVIDGQLNGGGGSDKIRIKISDKFTGNVVYDNQLGAKDDVDPTKVIAGGSIIIIPTTAFTGTPRTGTAPLDVKFSLSSPSPPPYHWDWDFGDGQIMSYSYPTNPSHVYSKAGSYTVNLTMIDAMSPNMVNSMSIIRPNYITVTEPPIPRITVTSPNGGETWQRGTTQTITWDYSGDLGSKVKIVLVSGDIIVGTINASTSIGSNGKGSYTWLIASSGVTGSGLKVSIQSISQPTVYDKSDKPFNLTPAGTITPSITVTSPACGVAWQPGTPHTVTWTYTGDPGPYVKVVLLKGGVEVGTATYSTSIGSGGTGSYQWAISSTRAPGSDYQIVVQSTSQPAVKGTSCTFTIGQPSITPTITVTAPNGGETWQRGTTKTVKWSFTGNPGSYVKVVLLKAGVEVGTATYSTSLGSGGTGSYPWAISSGRAPGTDYKILVQSVSQPTIKDASNNNFTITL